MKLSIQSAAPVETLDYVRVRAGSRGVEKAVLPFLVAQARPFPPGVEALVVAADLQGRVPAAGGKEREPPLLGIVAPVRVAAWLARTGIDPSRTGVLLAGDFHCDAGLARRGGFGDVRDVWAAFRRTFRWVVGVAGNHDDFGGIPGLHALRQTPGVHLLDGSVASVGGLRVAGISGVVGDPSKPWRHAEQEHAGLLRTAVAARPDLLLLHEGPAIREKGLEGNDAVRRHLEAGPAATVICGHRHWPGHALHRLANGTEVLNVEGKIVLLLPENPHAPFRASSVSMA